MQIAKLPDTLPYCGQETAVEEIVMDMLCTRMSVPQILDNLARRYERAGHPIATGKETL